MNTIAHNVQVSLEKKTYEIHIENNYVDNDMLKRLVNGLDHVIITDQNVFRHYTEILEGLNFIAIPSGEPSKSIEIYENVLNQMAMMGVSRKGIVIAFGGGVVGDLAGFVAATYMRGIRFIQIPTTLLAMVDSSVGGKVGINLESGKNLVGAFYQPEGVYIDPKLLGTLPTREWSNGMAEVIKYSVGFDEVLFKTLEALSRDDITSKRDGVASQIEWIISLCCSIKAMMVMADEKDQNVRNLLNFGHTIGHAIEHYYGYSRYLHGEAVAIGMTVVSRIAMDAGAISEAEFNRIVKLIEKFDLPTALTIDYEENKLFEAIKNDKKSTPSLLNWIALERIGALKIVSESPESAILKFIGGLNAQSKI